MTYLSIVLAIVVYFPLFGASKDRFTKAIFL